MRQLSARLAAVASQVRSGRRVADIGTDHAYLPVWLVEQGITPAAIACDIRSGPLAAACRTVEAAGLAAAISLRLGDGLAPVQPGEAENIVIAGMGAETIAAILQAAPWTRDARYRLILQPMSKPERLRRFLWENGYDILCEDAVAEEERLYVVMAVAFTGEKHPVALADCMIGRVPPTPVGLAFLQKQAQRVAQTLAGLPKTDPDYPQWEQAAARLAAILER